MEEKRDRNAAPQSQPFLNLLEQARNGDKQAMEQLLQLFEADFERLAAFIRLPREEALQTLKTEFIDMIRRGTF